MTAVVESKAVAAMLHRPALHGMAVDPRFLRARGP